MSLTTLLLCALSTAPIALEAPDAVGKKMAEALRLHDAAQTVSEEIVALDLLRATSEEHPDAWLPSYWTAYLCTQVARLQTMVDDYPEDVDPGELIHEALYRLGEARHAKGEMTPHERSDFHALRGFICTFESMFTETPADVIEATRANEYKAALRENPQSLLMMTLAATDFAQAGESLNDMLAAIALFDRADALFAKAGERSRTTYWARDFVPYWRGVTKQKLESMVR